MDILYELPAEHPLQPGDAVRVEIDWPRRYNLMRLHFAAELVLEVITHQLNGIEKIGAHIAPDKARLDFAWPESIDPHLAKLAVDVQKIIDEDIHITSAFSDEPLQRRYWEVSGFARVACGENHMLRTGEVGVLTLKRNNIGKGKERIEVFAVQKQAEN